MFTFIGDTVLDPFLGSGTTIKVALNQNRNSIGYEINEGFLSIIKEKIGLNGTLIALNNKIEIVKRDQPIRVEEDIDYTPNIKDAKPVISPDKFRFNKERLYKVVSVLSEDIIELDTGLKVKLLGVDRVSQKSDETLNYLEEYVKGKQIFLKFDPLFKPKGDIIPAYVFLKNKIFINKELIKQKLAKIPEYNFKYKNNFVKLIEGVSNG